MSSLAAIIARPAQHASLGALPYCGKDGQPHAALEPIVQAGWPIHSFWKGPFLGFRDREGKE